MTASLREVLRNTLDNLTEADFKRFKHYLRDQGQIAWRKLENADTDDNVDLIVQVYSTRAGDVMFDILKKMNLNQLAMDLERNLGRLGGQQSSLGLGGGVNVNAIAHSGGMVNAPAVTGCTIRGPVTFNFGRRHTPQQEGVTIRPQDKAELCSTEKISSLKRKLQEILKNKFLLIRQDLEETMGKRRKLQDIYTELCIIEGTTGVNNVHEVAAMQLRQMETRTCSGNSVELSNIFSDHYQTDEPAKKVLTLGIAGVGKTVAVQKFVLDWAENTNYEDIELVFVLPFRELNKHKDDNCTLSDLLLKFYPELELRESTKLKGAVLFVFDGLDESRLELDLKKFICDPKEKSPVAILITSLITGKMLPSAFIWVTTRPAAAKKDLCDLFDRVTEVQGFNEHQREEYLQKIIPEKAEQVITLLKKMRSLYIMCQIPVVCQITAIVLGETREEQKEIPKNLTEIYTQFCVFQINRMNDRYPEDKKMSAEEKGQLLVKLGKLAFKYLEKDTLIFYEKDLAECGINLKLGAQQSGLCTQIFKKENTISGESMFSFVHLTVQEFLAALYMLHSHATDRVNLLIKTWTIEWIFWWFKNSRFDLYKMSLNRALQSQNGHLDLCVRFLLGLAPMLEPKITHPLNLWLPKLAVRDVSIKKTVQYIKEKIGEDKSPERIINLFHCLNELGDYSLVEEINRKMKSAGEEMNLTPAQCSALAYLLLMSAEKLDEFDLKKYLRSEEGLRRMLPVVKVSKRVWLNQCHLYKESCEMMASVLQGTPTYLRELDMSGNDLQDEGLDLLCEGLTHPRCKLEKLRCAGCKLTERSYEIVASALQSANSPLRVLDLGHNGLQKSEEKLLAAFQSPNCKLEILRLAGSKLTERFLALTLQGATPNLRELDISDSKLQDCKGELLDQPLNQDYIVRPISCKLICCRLKHTSSVVVASVFQSFSSQLSDLDMSGSDLHTSEENLLSGLGNPNCQLKSLRLKDCKLTHESCEVVATFVQSATSLLELDLSKNDLRDSGVQLLSKGLSSPHCKLQTLRLSGCQITNQGCSLLASELKSCHSYLKELDLSYNHLGESGIRELTDIQNDPSCKLETFRYDHVATKDEMVKKKRSLKLKLQKHLEKRFSVVHQEAGDCKVQNIYAELHIVDWRTGGVSNEHEVTTINMGQIRTRPSSEDKQVKLANMFTDNSVTNVLTLGIAGVGKTIAVQKFVMDWVEEKANQDIDFVFVLSFRELNLKKGKHCNLLDVLESFYPYREDLEYILDLSECKILFVLDGLDESRLNLDFGKCIFTLEAESSVDILITSLIKGTLVPSALLWVTTRPAAASLIPEECFDLVREVRGFNDDQKDEFFWKNIHNPEKAKRLIDHINKNRSLHYMCRIPAFCRVLANVVDKLLKDQSKEASSKTLTEFYTLYCVSQIKTMNDKFPKKKKISEKEIGLLLVKLGKLAFTHLKNGTLIFNDKDLAECGIDVNWGALQTGVYTQIFNVESATTQENIFSFVHLSVQEFLAALFVLHEGVRKANPFLKAWKENTSWLFTNSRFDLYKFAVDEVLQSHNGHLDLFVRFLLGLAPMLEPEIRSPLNVVLPQLAIREVSINKTVQYIKEKIREDNSPERIINLFHCLNELGDNSLVEEITRYINLAEEEKILTPAQCSALAYQLLMSANDLDEFDLKKYLRSEEGLHRMLPVVEVSRRVWLNQCHLSKASCEMMASVLQGTPSHLRELDMRDNDLQDEGVELLCVGLRNPQCKLEILRLNQCRLSKASCKMMASVLQGKPSHLRELDMSDNDLQDEGIELLCVGLRDPRCKLETLRLSGCVITHKGCSFLASALKSNSSYLKQMDLSHNHIGDSGVLELTDRLNDPSCNLETFRYDHGIESEQTPCE